MTRRSSLHVSPISLRAANRFVAALHRHHDPDRGHKFSLSVLDDDGALRGVAICGRPKARMSDDGWTLEVTRVCTDGCRNACSALYGAARRTAYAMGYRRVITYTLASEPGTSLRAAGWMCMGPAGGGSWSRKSRPRDDHHPLEEKMLWEGQGRREPPVTTRFSSVAAARDARLMSETLDGFGV